MKSIKKGTRNLLVLLSVLVASSGCKSHDNEPQAGSETNFLQRCDAPCGKGTSCLCGVCTRACTGAADCSELAQDAQCISVYGHPDAGASGTCQQGATCDFSCIRTSDCGALGSDYRCDAGYCRKGDLLCPAVALPPGDLQRDIVIDGTTRTYLLHVPPGYTGNAPVPLVVDFHPIGLPVAWEVAASGFKALSDREGFIVAFPQGIDNNWNVGPCCTTDTTIDDFGFVEALVRQLSVEACIDPQRIHTMGDSGGGFMAYYSACKHAEVFASIAVSSMDLFADSVLTCEPSRPVTEISFRGTADTVVPYAGGTSSPPGHPEFSLQLLGAVGTFQKWAAIDQCTGSASPQDSNGCSTYESCQNGTKVTLCSAQGAGQYIGDANLTWSVLKAHPMQQ